MPGFERVPVSSGIVRLKQCLYDVRCGIPPARIVSAPSRTDGYLIIETNGRLCFHAAVPSSNHIIQRKKSVVHKMRTTDSCYEPRL